MTPRLVVRVGRGATVVRISRTGWGVPGWQWQHADGSFGCRWDDPDGGYRVAYMARTALGAYLEALAGFRPDPALVDDGFMPDPAGSDVPTIPPGQVPRSWIGGRRRLDGRLHGRFARVTATASIGVLRRLTASVEARTGARLDAAGLRAVEPRAFTQGVGRVIFAMPAALDGIAYGSRHGDDEECIAAFERRPLDTVVTDQRDRSIDPDDPDLIDALDLLGIRLAP